MEEQRQGHHRDEKQQYKVCAGGDDSATGGGHLLANPAAEKRQHRPFMTTRNRRKNSTSSSGDRDGIHTTMLHHNNKSTVDAPRDATGTESNKVRQYATSFVVIVGVAVSWALAVQFRKSTLVIDPTHFYAPFTLVWFSTSLMIICLPVYLLFAFATGKNLRHEQRAALKVLRTRQDHFNIWNSFLCPLFFLALWTVINYAYAQALGLISAGAASAIMSASTALVWILGWIMLGERFAALKVFVAVLIAMGGVLLVAMDNEFAANRWGICLAILSTVVASFYKVMFKLCVGNASLGQVSLFMTVIGVLNLLLNTVISGVLLQLDYDHIEWEHIPWAPLIGSALLGLVFNFFVNFGIALLDPLVISIGMLFGMPLSACIDFLFRSMPISALFLVGSLLITVSFVLIAFPVELGIRAICCCCRPSSNQSSADDDNGEEQQKSSSSPLNTKNCEETPFRQA